jgi:hypothetical protein
LKSLKGVFKLPSKETMMADLEEYIKEKKDRGIPLKSYHNIKDEVRSYVQRLETMADLEPLTPIYYNLLYATNELRKIRMQDYRNAIFEVVDNFDFKVSGVPVDKEELIIRKYFFTPEDAEV